MIKIQEVEFTHHWFTNQKIKFHNNLVILIGKHCAGKTTLLDILSEGFQGKKAHFLVNNQKVSHSDFQVIHLKDQFNLKEEIKLNKTSPFRNHILKTINHHLLTQVKYQKVTNEIQKLALAIEKVIAELFASNLKALTNENIILKFAVDKINLESIVDELLEIDLFDVQKQTVLKESNFNQFLMRMVVFNVLKTATDDKDLQRPIVILFDNPELYTTLKTCKQLNTILQELMTKHNCYLVLASNSVEYLMNLPHSIQSLNWLCQDTIFHFIHPDKLLQQGVGICEFLSNDKYSNWLEYVNDFDQIFGESDLVSEWNYFNQNVYKYLLMAFFLDQIVLTEKTSLQPSGLATQLKSNQLLGNYSLPIKSICLLFVFLDHCNFAYQFAQKLCVDKPKITLVFSKTTKK